MSVYISTIVDCKTLARTEMVVYETHLIPTVADLTATMYIERTDFNEDKSILTARLWSKIRTNLVYYRKVAIFASSL